jgi:cell division protein FtsZ
VAHPDANIIVGQVIDDAMGDEVRVTVIAAGFDRWDESRGRHAERPGLGLDDADRGFIEEDDIALADDDDFDVPSFLK